MRNSSLLLSNATVWVEGITDRMYIRKFIELVQKGDPHPMREDVHFSFVEYGGANVVHWSVLEDDGETPQIDVDHLCGTLMLIADNDAGNHKTRLERIRTVLRDRFIELPGREIENLLAPEVLKRSVAEMAPGGSLPSDVTHLDYLGFPLGEWIDKKIAWEGEPKRRKFAAESGTIRPKLVFARIACTQMKELADLSEEAKDLAKKIVGFVRSQNPQPKAPK
jgi:hypothetical protein